MSRCIVFVGGLLLLLLTAVASIPRLQNEFEPEVVFNLIPESQEPFKLSSFNPFSRWENNFADRYAYEVEDTPDVKDLFSSSQLEITSIFGDKIEKPVKYIIGKRVPNDRLVSSGVDGGKWSSPVNISLTMKYPASGQGAKVTYAELIVEQSSKTGKVIVTAGGIGQRFITIVLQANNTIYFGYKEFIYGI